MKRLGKKIRHYWHDLYYGLAPAKGVSFAMTCRDATSAVDLGHAPNGALGVLRLKLHLTLCQACKNYQQLTEKLGIAIRDAAKSAKVMPALEKLNQDLLNKHSERQKKESP